MATPVLGTSTTIKIGGTSTAFSQEATTRTTANTVYQLTTAAKRAIDPAVAVVVEVDADGAGGGAYATAAAADYSVDYLFGTITFTADQGASALVRVSGNYIPLVSVATGRMSSLDLTHDLKDSTVFGDTAPNSYATRKSCAMEFELIEDLFTDHDSGAGSKVLSTLLDGGTPVLMEVWPGGAGTSLRAWGLLSKGSIKTPGDDLVSSTISFQNIVRDGSGQTERTHYGWGTST